MGISYNEIESNSVGYKEDYEMHSMDFEEFLWAMGYNDEFTADLLSHMLDVRPLSELQMDTLMSLFRDYVIIGACPKWSARM